MSSSSSEPVRIDEAERLHLLFEAITDCAIYMLDADGLVTTWNPGAQRLKGYTPAEIIGQPYARFFTQEEREAGLPARMLAEARATGRCEGEGWRVRKDGTRFWALMVLQSVRDRAGRHIGFAKVTRDITERQAAQQALLESERRFRHLVEGVTDYAIYMLDPSGIVVNWNAGAQHIKGYAADEIIGHHFSRFYTKEDRRAGMPTRVLEAAARDGRFEAEGWRVRKDGSRFWANVVMDAIRNESGELIGFAKVTRDITERRRVHEALRESERQFRLLVSGVTDYALYMLDPNGIITNWNAGAERIKGYSADEIIGQHFAKFYTDADRAAGLPAISLYTAAEEGRFEAEGWRVRKDGTLFWANVVIDSIRDEDRKLIGFAKITRDITERREAQKALQEAQAQLSQAQKMEALGQLTGGVAHDFNNLLMVISGYIRTIRALVGEDPKGRRAVEAIETAAKRGESLTRQLLTFARRQNLNPVVVDLREAVETIRAMLASTAGRITALSTTVMPGIWTVEVDPSELELAILNLTLNARDAMPEGGMITITAENARLEPPDTPAKLTGDFVAVTVADTGCGIPGDIIGRVFDPFFTTKAVNHGTGLGLSQVHGFAHQSGGTVTIATELGKGTRVTIYLPRARSQPSELAAEQEELGGSRPGSALLVEDNPEVAEASQALLEELGFRVHAVPGAEAALQAIAENRYDFVLSDIVMAGPMNGLALARAIRARQPDLPIILATGYSTSDGPTDEFIVLRKPYQLIDLSRAVNRVIGQGQADQSNLVSFEDLKRDGISRGD